MGYCADKSEEFFLKEKGIFFIKEEYKYITNIMQQSSSPLKNKAEGKQKALLS
jgi:hypothetical protein